MLAWWRWRAMFSPPTTRAAARPECFHGASVHNASVASVLTATTVLRWLPLAFFPFIAAQIYNVRPSVPLTAVSFVLRLRRRRGDQAFTGRYLDVSYPYFIVCVFSAGIHANQGDAHLFLGAMRFDFVGAVAAAVAAVWHQSLGGRVRGGGRAGLCWADLASAKPRGWRKISMRNGWRGCSASRTDAAQSVTAIGQIGRTEIVPAHRHPAGTPKSRRRAGIFARGQLPELQLAQPDLVCRRLDQ